MYKINKTKKFQKSLIKLLKSGRVKRSVYEEIEFVIQELASGKKLAANYRNHKLQGDLIGRWECHIKGDLLLMYSIHQLILVLEIVDIGTHSELF